MRSLHASGWVKAPDAQVRSQVAVWAVEGFDFISHTEAAGRRGMLTGHKGYDLAQAFGTEGQAEVALMVAVARWRIVSTKAVPLSSLGIPRRGGQRPYAPHVIVEDRATGLRHHRLVIHLPSGVEGLRGLRRGEQARVWRDAVQTLVTYVAGLGGPVVITGDWNVSLRRAWVRALLADLFPGFDVTPIPKRGRTHGRFGRRFIDFSLYRGFTPTAARVVPNIASDHRALVERASIKEPAVPGTPKTDAFVAALRRRGVEVLTHDQWGSVRRDVYRQRLTSRPHGLLPGTPVDTLWNHVTVTFDDGVLVGEFKADCREVERIGFDRFGSGVSYNILVDANATKPRVAIGQFLEAKGTHTVNDKKVPGFSRDQNLVALAVAWVGMPGNKLNAHAITAMVQLRAALIEVGALTTHYDDVPHSLVAFKDCPTDELRNRLPELKRLGLAAVARPAVKLEPTRVTRARVLLEQALKFAGPRRRAALKAALDRLPKR